MKKLKTERTDAMQVFPFPTEGETVWENPPCFIWLDSGAKEYNIKIKGENGFAWEGKTDRNYIVPPIFFPPGKYTRILSAPGFLPDSVNFTIHEKAVKFSRPTGEEIFNACPENIHPRHLFFAEDIPQIVKNHQKELEVLKRNIEKAYADGLPNPPDFYASGEKNLYKTNSTEYFCRYREFVDRNLTACALGYALTGDIKAGKFAVKLFSRLTSWDTEGECSLFGGFCDEIGLSNARCFPAVYDLLYDLLSESERLQAENAIYAYALQCERRLTESDYIKNPGNSHAGRIPAYLGEAALVLKGTKVQKSTLLRWLDLSAEIFGGIFPFYGGPDGSWGESPFYASSYTKWYLPFFNAVERYTGKSYLCRPFYQRFTQYLLHFLNPDEEIHPFGDGYMCKSDDSQWSGFAAQNPFSVYAEKFGPEQAVQIEQNLKSPDLFLLHLLDIFLPIKKNSGESITGEASNIAAFPYAGLISMRKSLTEKSKNTVVISRAGRYGSASHAHADQGSFCLFYEGTALISPSGYFGRCYGTTHHFQWTKTTKAHNCILVNGIGQPFNSHLCTAKIIFCGEKDGAYISVSDLTKAYPMLKKYTRKLTLYPDLDRLKVEDFVESETSVKLDWLLHSLSRPKSVGNGCAFLERNGTGLDIIPICGLENSLEIKDKFDIDINADTPEEFKVQKPAQFHMRWETQSRKSHYIAVEFQIIPKKGEREESK